MTSVKPYGLFILLTRPTPQGFLWFEGYMAKDMTVVHVWQSYEMKFVIG
jgi:hypothetical protein